MNRLCVPLILMLLGAMAPTMAEELSDPTRPPAGIVWGDGAGGSGNGAEATTRPQPTMKGLTSVILAPGRCAAVIDGKTVRLGEMHDGARLVEIDAGSVQMLGNKGRRTLLLFQGIGLSMKTDGAPPRAAASCRLETAQQEQTVRKKPARSGSKEKS